MKNIKQGWMEFSLWVRNHPLKAVMVFIISAGLSIGYAETKAWPFIALYIILLAVFAAAMTRDNKRLALLLTLSLLLPSKGNAQEQPEPAGVAAGVTVVVVGGVVVYFFYSFCKKHFPKPDTNSVQQLNLGGDTTSAASQQWFGGYCIGAPDLATSIEESGETVVRGIVAGDKVESLKVIGLEQRSSRQEFQDYLTKLGLPLEYGTHYAVGGVPVESWQSPIQFTERGAIPCVMINGAGEWRTNVIERTIDLKTWTPILTNIAPSNLKFSFTDNSDAPQAFYRVRN